MKLVDMKRSAKERKGATKCAPYEGDTYSYGLRVRLDSDDIEKLGIALPKVGEVFVLEAQAAVTSVSQSESDNHKHRSIEFVLKKIGLEKGPRSMLEAVKGAVK